MTWHTTRYTGVQVRHRKGCAAPEGRCRCVPSYRVRYRRDGKPAWSHVFHDLAEARNWQTDTRRRKQATATGETFQVLAERFLALAKSGQVAQRGGESYRARTLNIYERGLKQYVYPTYGDRPAAGLTIIDWQLLVDDLGRMGGRKGEGLSRNTLHTTLNGVRAAYRWACAPTRRLLPVNESRGLELPAKDEIKRDRIAPPDEARRLLAVLSEPCDVLDFGLALYAGLRNMERTPLLWEDVDLNGRRLYVRKSKTEAGIRTLPIIGLLLPILLREHLRQGRPESGRVVRGPKGGAVSYWNQALRVREAWDAAGLEHITPHECRHTFASYLIAAGVNAKAVTELMGHASITETFDRYGHLFPGDEDEAGALLDALLGVPDPAVVTTSVTIDPSQGKRRAKVQTSP